MNSALRGIKLCVRCFVKTCYAVPKNDSPFILCACASLVASRRKTYQTFISGVTVAASRTYAAENFAELYLLCHHCLQSSTCRRNLAELYLLCHRRRLAASRTLLQPELGTLPVTVYSLLPAADNGRLDPWLTDAHLHINRQHFAEDYHLCIGCHQSHTIHPNLSNDLSSDEQHTIRPNLSDDLSSVYHMPPATH